MVRILLAHIQNENIFMIFSNGINGKVNPLYSSNFNVSGIIAIK